MRNLKGKEMVFVEENRDTPNPKKHGYLFQNLKENTPSQKVWKSCWDLTLEPRAKIKS